MLVTTRHGDVQRVENDPEGRFVRLREPSQKTRRKLGKEILRDIEFVLNPLPDAARTFTHNTAGTRIIPLVLRGPRKKQFRTKVH